MNIVDTSDEYFMRQALAQAQLAFSADEVPVGAVLVYQNKVVVRDHNRVEALQDATAHAEILCLSAASEIINDWRLIDCTLYTTLEPCLMCAGAILESRISRLVWGAPDLRLGANGSWLDVFSMKHPMHCVAITTNILAAESADLMRRFFKKKKKN